jgi:protein-S-isoprenylcysteine O-methyltransferase Ste14
MTGFRPTTLLLIVWVGSEIALGFARRSGTRGADSRDRSSLRILWTIIVASITASMFLTGLHRGTFGGSGTIWPNLGRSLIVAGMALRWWAILSLGRAFTVDVAIAQDQRLVDHGLYRVIRHPSYTGAILSFVGFGLMLGSWPSLLAIVVPITAAFHYRIGVEERALCEGFGEAYVRYMQRTRRLVPFLY